MQGHAQARPHGRPLQRVAGRPSSARPRHRQMLGSLAVVKLARRAQPGRSRQHACGSTRVTQDRVKVGVSLGSSPTACALQDLAVVELVRRVAPNLAIHGSTQMSITSADGAEFARLAGAARVVVGRELSVDEIAQARP